MNTQYEHDDKIKMKLSGLVYQQLELALVSEFIIFTIILAILWNNENRVLFLAWYVISEVLNAIRFGIARYYNKKVNNSLIDIQKWISLLMVLAFLGGACYAPIGSLFMPTALSVKQIVIIFCLIGITALANIIYSPIKYLYLFFLFPAYIPHIIWLFFQGETYILLGIAAVIYLLLMMRFSTNINHIITNSVQLQFENLRLIDNLAIKNEKLKQSNLELKEREHAMVLINKINDKLQMCHEIGEAYTIINKTANELFHGWSGGIVIFDQSGQNLQTVTQWGNHQILKDVFCKDDCVAIRNGSIHIVEEFKNNNECHHFSTSKPQKYLCIPLIVSGKVIGILNINDHEGKIKTNNYQQQLAITLSEVVALSVANINLRDNLRQQSLHDPLTGLFNRRYLDETFPIELQRVIRNKSTLSVGMIDLDHFKHFNDTYGHKAGDEVLQFISQLLREYFRGSDFACRYGGDEFIIILIDSSKSFAFQRLQAFQHEVKLAHILFNKNPLPTVTVSIGLAEVPLEGTTLDDILNKADQALYAAKQQGRDRIVI
ncbi:regulatory protein (GGDEF, PAS, PAC domains) [Legionella santicrucis]|uniref:diguanylate cyclase n=1 Tax=Legionella santicrucis TaxID=45074 RepID=A0A0W0YMK6_9GAMM|nr:sensor domain-containing diguanylate cyclase [Legionella santicrucis]KTD57854.1 regulatory protein (GGDEF, PAS, PAC domains) [Legionella santicrucis]